MRILHITTIDKGGAFKAVSRLNSALNKCGYVSEILVRNKTSEESDVIVCNNTFVKSVISKVKNGINLLFARNDISRDLLGTDISKNKSVKDADIIVLHWINSFLSYNSLKAILDLNKTVVFFLHDMWLFTGGCHYSLGCSDYLFGCQKCNKVAEKNFCDKVRLLKDARFKVIAPSNWMAVRAKDSMILKGKEVYTISNCYNPDVFYPRRQNEIREKYSIPESKRIVLVGADRIENEVKGVIYSLEAVKLLDEEKYHILFFGNIEDKLVRELKSNYTLLDYISSEEELAQIYSISDCFLSTAIQEAFGYTVCEALACGTPVVAYDVGGITDQVEHKMNGYLVDLFNTDEVIKGIEYCCENRDALSEEAEKRAVRFSDKVIIGRYIEVFESMT